MMSELYKKEIDKDGVATLTLNRPEIHNAFNDELISGLTDEFKKLSRDQDIRLIILTGEGKSFCAGADLNWMKSMVSYTEEENKEDSENLAALFLAINECSKPVIGKVNGHALGGGVGLVSCCDLVVSSDKAMFGFSEVRLGLIPATISPFVINKIGESHARAWFLSGERFNAESAKHMGLVHRVVPLAELDFAVERVIEEHLLAGPKASVWAKTLIKNVTKFEEDVTDYTCSEIAKIRISDEGQEGMNALLEKRKPNWIKE
jgi:methylglutaconyl-CoA hydratase